MTVARLAAPGAAVHEPPRELGGGFDVASARDPSGHVLGLTPSPHGLAVGGVGAAP